MVCLWAVICISVRSVLRCYSLPLPVSIQQLKKRHVTLKMKLSELKGIDTELEMEGGLEELRRDSWMYQKRAMLRVR